MRLYADFNGIKGRAGAGLSVALDTFETLRSLANAQLRLREGVRLIIFDWSDDQDDLEADAHARFDTELGMWWADLGAEGYRYVPAAERTNDAVFLCVMCRCPLDEHIRKNGLEVGDECPACKTPIHAPIIPEAGIAALRRAPGRRPSGT